MRAEALRVHGLCTRGISSKLVWGLLPTEMDPAVKADLMPIERYCKDLWVPEGEAKVTLSDEDLKEAYTAAQAKRQGPIWAATKAMQQAEWMHTDWDTVKLRNGTDISLRQCSPGLVKKFYLRDLAERSYDDWWFEMSIRKGSRGSKPDKVPLKEWLADKKITRSEQLAGIRTFAGAMPTKARLKRWGANIEVACEFCGEDDNWEHRLWQCTATADLREKQDEELKELGRTGFRAQEYASKSCSLGIFMRIRQNKKCSLQSCL